MWRFRRDKFVFWPFEIQKQKCEITKMFSFSLHFFFSKAKQRRGKIWKKVKLLRKVTFYSLKGNFEFNILQLFLNK